MKTFMSEDFLLDTPTAVHLYNDYAKDMPIVDYHCHINPQEIYEDRKFDNIAQVWLGGKYIKEDGSIGYAGDHYKWRLMRAHGVSEDYILGDQPDYERFIKFVETLEMTIGNPMNHWCQLELKNYFDYTKPICLKNADEIWKICNERLQNDPDRTARGFIRSSKVKLVGTTDDPVDSLKWHQLIKEDPTIDFLVTPSFRPDKTLNIQNKGFKEYILELSKVSEIEIKDADSALLALEKRLDFFASMGCRASDHGLEAIPYHNINNEQASIPFTKVMNDEAITNKEMEDWQSYLLTNLGKMYAKRNIVMQYHYNAMRNTNQRMFEEYGADTGYDAMDGHNCVHGIQGQLSAMSYNNECPKTVLYSLNPTDMDMMAVIAGCFQTNAQVKSRIQLGAAWWFNDTKDGMENQIKVLARLGILGDFIGMLTDSRSFLSYARHEYFRRILCNIIGNWVENGEYPDDDDLLKRIVEGICYKNAKEYFNL